MRITHQPTGATIVGTVEIVSPQATLKIVVITAAAGRKAPSPAVFPDWIASRLDELERRFDGFVTANSLARDLAAGR